MKVAGKVVVVTGGGNGMGREVVVELLRRGARVAAVDIRQDGLDQTASLVNAGDRLATFQVDITDRAAVEALPGRVEDALGAPDGIVNVAGIIQPFDKLLDVNLWGTIHMVKTFLPGLMQRPVAHVANVSSMGGSLPVPGQTIYGASKAAVKLMTEGLYAELRDTDVAVSLIFPGAVKTDITTNSGVESPGGAAAAEKGSKLPISSAEDAGRMIVDGIEDDDFHVFVGKDSRVLNLLNPVVPRQSTHFIQKQMKDLLSR